MSSNNVGGAVQIPQTVKVDITLNDRPVEFDDAKSQVIPQVYFNSTSMKAKYRTVMKRDVGLTQDEDIKYSIESKDNPQCLKPVAESAKYFVQRVVLQPDFLGGADIAIPKLLISITGAAQWGDAKPSDEVFNIFNKGLSDTANATNAWIVSGGTEAGIMQVVGSAHKNIPNNDIPCIGIVSLPALAGAEQFADNDEVMDYKRKEGTNLDPNHTHFILVNENLAPGAFKFGHEIEFRSNFEARICETLSIPLLLVAFGGGPGTLLTIYEGVLRGFPVLIFYKSGGVCDAVGELILYMTQHKKSNVFLSKNKLDPEFRKLLTGAGATAWRAFTANMNDKKRAEAEEQLYHIIVRHKLYVRVYDRATNEKKFSLYMFESIFASEVYGNMESKIKLSIACNQEEVVADIISSIEDDTARRQWSGYAITQAITSDKPSIYKKLWNRKLGRYPYDLTPLYATIFTADNRPRFFALLSQRTMKLAEELAFFQGEKYVSSKKRLFIKSKDKVLDEVEPWKRSIGTSVIDRKKDRFVTID
eukprot:TRINITY_DN2003_c2_g1_i1.p1 TRINITY_DN2003_c2_g1~~TRINITY_DN2003_c2_g1_i1.p1  ORF type:complete len:532 (+),score=122.44 TRINITY_DN2003_c2_g1_i1:142-1737(+)